MEIFVNSTPETRAYYTKQYSASNPNSNNKVAYTVKKGDNLWNIAKQQIKNKNASNAEISEMMYSIAKLNKKETIEAANDIKINDVIYIPVYTEKSNSNKKISKTPNNSAANSVKTDNSVKDIQESPKKIKEILTPPNPHATYTEKQLYKSKHINNIDNKLYSDFGKYGAQYWTKLLNNPNSQLIIEKSYTIGSKPTGIILTKKDNNKRYGKTEAMLLIRADKNGKFDNVVYNSPGTDIYSTRFDFEVDKKGQLKRPNSFGIYTTIDKIEQKQYQELVKGLQKYLDENLK